MYKWINVKAVAQPLRTIQWCTTCCIAQITLPCCLSSEQAKRLYQKQRNSPTKSFIHVYELGKYICLYSDLSDISGSTFVARRAGIQHASSEKALSRSAITVNVSGSVVLTPNNSARINRVNAKAATGPT